MMEVVVIDENERVHITTYGIPTIQLGDGQTVVSDIYTLDGLHGICFSPGSPGDYVGMVQDDTRRGESTHDIGAFLQILTDDPLSLDILIGKLLLAKESLMEKHDE